MRPKNYILALITFPALLISHPLLAVPLDFPASSALCDNPSVGTLGTLPSLLPIGSSNEADRKDLELRDRVLRLAASGQVSQALQVAQTIEKEIWKVSAMQGIAVELTTVGQVSQALQVVQGIKDESGKYWALFDMAVKLAEAGQVEQALQVAQAVEKDSWKTDILDDIA
ncbi:MAG: hypothetical protein ICV55_12955, partial [Coleofasciculus sp. C3-bin4]|nr:hypothetical protein [Coleofasciculus sp. C3-bin4]